MSRRQTIPELPSLETGIHLLNGGERLVGPLQTLVLDHLLMEGGDAVWIDAHNYGTSVYLTDVAPSPRILDRIHIARGFTPYQHNALVQDTIEELDSDTGIIVVPAVDALYRSEDVRGTESQTLFVKTLARLASYARDTSVPILTTRVADDGLSAPLERLAESTLNVEQTPFGPRFQSEDFETLVYNSDGRTRQTTLSYWARILRARQPVYENAPEPVATSGRV